jgi:four helix bundle protein
MKNDEIKSNLIVRTTFEFSIMILNYCEQLDTKRKFILSNQLLKSGTSIGANVWEAQNAESKSDFIHKFKIAAKEMEETKYWLLLCKNFEPCPNPQELILKLNIIHKIITKIISTSKKSMKSKIVIHN